MQFWIVLSLSILFAICGIKFGHSAWVASHGTSTGNIGILFLNFAACIVFILLTIGFSVWSYISK